MYNSHLCFIFYFIRNVLSFVLESCYYEYERALFVSPLKQKYKCSFRRIALKCTSFSINSAMAIVFGRTIAQRKSTISV